MQPSLRFNAFPAAGIFVTALVLVVLALVLPAPAARAAELSEHLAPLAPFVGKTWRGELSEPGAAAPKIDISRWEVALNGQAIRILHSVNQGEYGGETLVVWDRAEESIVYYYFTTAGFYTHGTMRFEGDKLVSQEAVTGNENGITEVKSVSEVLPDGRMKGVSQYLQNGKWVPGHTAIYEEAPEAKVIFK